MNSLKSSKKKLKDCKKLDNYIEMRAEGDISKEVFKIKTSELEDKVLALNKEISALVE